MKSFLIFYLFFGAYSLSIAQITIDSLRLLNNLEHLSHDQFRGRETGTPENALARDYLLSQFDTVGLMPLDSTFHYPFTFWNRLKRKKYEGVNIVGHIKGTQTPTQYIVVSAHYDHVGVRNAQIYNGADDNASGACALIEMADFFIKNPPKYSILIVGFDAEELGLQGAKCWLDAPPVPKDSIILNLNMDMISRNDSSVVNICGTHHYPFLKPFIQNLLPFEKIQINFGHDGSRAREQDWTYSSDHGIFHKAQIPFLYLGVEDHRDYHQPTDDFERIHPAFYVQVVRLATGIVQVLDHNIRTE